MKKIIALILIVFFYIFFPNFVRAWLDCPFGKINDPYPGSCARYIDTNKNDICDHSEPEPTVPGSFEKQDSFSVNSAGNLPTYQSAGFSKTNLYFWTFFLTLFFYFLSWYLVFKTNFSKKSKWFSQMSFRFFWNMVLVITFFPTAISSIIILFFTPSKILSFWHNFFGLIFVVVGFFHFLGRVSYFKIFKKLLE